MRGNSSGECTAPVRLPVFEKSGLGRHLRPGLEDEAVSLQPDIPPVTAAMSAARIDQGPMAITTASPSTSRHRPRRLRRAAPSPHDARDLSETQLGSLRLRRPHHRCGEFCRDGPARWYRSSPDAAIDGHPDGKPIDAIGVLPWRPSAGDAAIGGEAAIAPVAADFLGEAGVQRKTAPRERLERRAVAPVERQKAAGFAGGGTGEPGALDDGRLDPAAAQEIGDRGADDAAATNQHTH